MANFWENDPIVTPAPRTARPEYMPADPGMADTAPPLTIRPDRKVNPAAPWENDPIVTPATMAPSEARRIGEDVVGGFVGGVNRGVAAIPGLPGMATRGLDWVADTVVKDGIGRLTNAIQGKGFVPLDPRPMPAPEGVIGQIRQATDPRNVLPTPQQTIAAYEGLTGPTYHAQTVPGQFAQTVGEFLPMSGGGLARATVPALASETAGQLAKGTPYEPYARAAGAIVGGVGTEMALRRPAAERAVASAAEGMTAQQLDDLERLMADAQAVGIPLTRAEAAQAVTNGATRLSDMQRIVEGQGGLRPMMAQRPGQVEAAGRQTFDQVAPVPGNPYTTGPAVGQAAEGIANDVRGAINTATEPLYTAAAAQRIPPQQFQQMQAAPGWQAASQAIRNDPQLARYVAGLPDDSVGFANEVQKFLRQQADNAASPVAAQQNMQRAAGFGRDANLVEGTARAVSPELDAAITAQAALRQKYLDPLLAGPIGKLANRDITTQKAVEALFPANPVPNSAPQVLDAVQALSQRAPEAARQLVRAHLESQFNLATKDLVPGPNGFGGAKFAVAVRGNQQAAENLSAAIAGLPNGQQVLAGFDRFLDVLSATGQRQRIGSQTAFNQEALAQMKQGGAVNQAMSVVSGGGLKLPGHIMDKFQAWNLGRNTDEIARLLTDPAAAKVFRTLAQAPPASQQALVLVARLAALSNRAAASRPNEPAPQAR